MIRFLLRRFGWFVVTLFAVVTISFFLMRAVKGGPFDAERDLHPAIERNMLARYNLDWPKWKQFLQYIGPINLDRDGLKLLSRTDPERLLSEVKDAHGNTLVEGDPRPIPHLEATPALEENRLDKVVARFVSDSDPASLRDLRQTSIAAQVSRSGEDPVLPPLFSALEDAHRNGDTAAVDRICRGLSEITGHSVTGLSDGDWMTADQARVRQWFGWYYDNGGDVLWNSGTDVFTGVLAGDFGPSFRYRDYTVNQIIEESLPISVRLGVLALAIALALGLTAGLLSALKRGGALDLSLRLAATVGIALPNFVIAGFLIILFVFKLGAFPVAGWGTLKHMILPAFALGAPFAAYIARLTRTGMLESLSQDHIRTARAKGLSPAMVVLRHALKGGALPVVSYLGPATAGILTGSLVIERIFFIPGTGSHFINSALSRDYTLAMGVTILYTVLVYTLNTVVDLAYTFLDPRIDLESE
ncbi:MAG: ABC-type dipeptide/oligopeptide/nickel transport system permease component [Planctomycetota bacterium]